MSLILCYSPVPVLQWSTAQFTRSAYDFVGMERNILQDGLFEPQSKYRGKSEEDLKSFWTCDKIPSF